MRKADINQELSKGGARVSSHYSPPSRGLNMRSLGDWVAVGLVTCILMMLLTNAIFILADAGGTTIGRFFRFIGAALYWLTVFLAGPLWLVALAKPIVPRTDRLQVDSARGLPFFLFITYAALHLLFANPEWREATIERLLYTVPIMLLALPLCNRRGCNMFWTGMAMAGVLFFLILLLSGQLLSILTGGGIKGLEYVTEGRLNLDRDTITSAMIIFSTVLSGLLWLMSGPRKIGLRMVGISIFGCLLICGLLTGSRGPLIAFCGAILVGLFTFRIDKASLWKAAAAAAIVIVIAVSFALPLYELAGSHLTQVDGEDSGRGIAYQYVIDSDPTIFGHGIGAFGANSGDGIGSYVHNSVLEVYYEMGLVGVALFLWLLGSVARPLLRIARASHDLEASFILTYLVFGFTESLFSGSVFGQAPLWVGLVLGLSQFRPLTAQAHGAHAVFRRQAGFRRHLVANRQLGIPASDNHQSSRQI